MSLIPWKNKQRESGAGELLPLAELRSEVDRLFDSFMRQPFGSLLEGFGRRGWEPSLEISESDQEVVVRAEVPGVPPENLEVSITGRRLTLAGEKHVTRDQDEKGQVLAETQYGRFQRIVDLPTEVEGERVSAVHAHGVLTIRLPKQRPAKTQKINVTSG
jgi:HSP20 family protein